MKKTLNKSKLLIFIILLIIAIIFLIPFIWTLLTSLKMNKDIYSSSLIIFPSRLSIEHYLTVITRMKHFKAFITNTMIVTVISVAATAFFSCMTGYAFSKLRFFGKKIYFTFLLLVLMLPYAIYLIPIYLMEDRFNLINTHMALILPYIAINLPLSTFIMRGTFNNIPNEFIEAATIDGCNFLQVWYKIMLPIAKPGIATVIIFTFISVWGEFLFARTLTNTPDAQTISVGILFIKDEAGSWQFGTLSATITLSIIPLLIIYLSMQRYFIKGIMEGALKG